MPQSCACCPKPVLEGDVERNRYTAPTVVPAPDPAQDHDLQTRSEIPDLVELGFSERRNPAIALAM